MSLIKTLLNEGYNVEFEKGDSDNFGFDIIIKISKGDDLYEINYSMSHESGKYYSSEFTNNYYGEGEYWDFDNDKLICEYLCIDKLTIIN